MKTIDFTETDMLILTLIIGQMGDALDALEDANVYGDPWEAIDGARNNALDFREMLWKRAGVLN